MIADRPLLGFSCVMLLDGREGGGKLGSPFLDLPGRDLFTILQRPIYSIVGAAYYQSLLHTFPIVHSSSHSMTMAQEYIVAPKSPPDLNIPEGNVAVKVSCIDR
jgi:hypothetical protein